MADLRRAYSYSGHYGYCRQVPLYSHSGALMEILSVDELKAVVAHEMGHAKYRHLLFYILFILGFMALSFGLFDVFFYFFAAHPFFIRFLETAGAETTNLFQLLVSVG